MIELRNVSKTYASGTTAVDNLSLQAPSGKITALVGPSGCGKTTTLRMINRLEQPSAGTILLDGEDTAGLDVIRMRRRIGYVIQHAGLFPHHTVLDNVCAVPLLNGTRRERARSRARELLQLVGLEADVGQRYPWQLSGGQQQRVGVARALAADPPFLLMDEPFSAVDPLMRTQLQDEFLRIQARLAKTIVLVTHDMDEALRLGDQVAVLGVGGVLAQVGSPAQILARPANDFVADFLGASRGYHALNFSSLQGLQPQATATLALDAPAGTRAGQWLVALDGARPLGWARVADPQAHLQRGQVTPARAVSLSRGNRRQLLDACLASPSGRAIVVDEGGNYRGTVGADLALQGALAAPEGA